MTPFILTSAEVWKSESPIICRPSGSSGMCAMSVLSRKGQEPWQVLLANDASHAKAPPVDSKRWKESTAKIPSIQSV